MQVQPHVMRTKVAEQLGVPVSMLNNIMTNKKNIPQQHVTPQPGRKKLKTSKYEKTESVFTASLTLSYMYCTCIRTTIC
jgi:hypothetical protein